MQVLPFLQHFRTTGGLFRLPDQLQVFSTIDFAPPERLGVERLREAVKASSGVDLPTHAPCALPPDGGISLGIEPVPPPSDCQQQGYRLAIRPDGVELVGATATGLLYGLETLCGIAQSSGRQWACQEIEDRPAYAVRGLSFDVTRGRVPTLPTLKQLVDRLAHWKVNHLQLYVEHTFDFAFDPDIAHGCSPLTAGEIRELDEHCALRRVALVPSLASFGHMGRILSLPQYRELAEIEATKSWEQMSWLERMHGLTLDPCDERARDLLSRMYGEYLPLFRARLANITCDETYDLGKGKNEARANRNGLGLLYAEHLNWLHGLCRGLGKRAMFWGDVAKSHPRLLEQIPQDLIVLDWDYSPDSDFAGTRLFREAGFTTFVCPGTSGWNRLVNNIGSAERNIRRFAAAGIEHGAAGLLNTDWGDEGHFNLPGCAWHPIALGAAMAWNPNAPSAAEFDAALGHEAFGDRGKAAIAALRRAAQVMQVTRAWPLLYAPFAETKLPEGVGRERLYAWRAEAFEYAKYFDGLGDIPGGWGDDARDMAVASRMNALLAEKLLLCHAMAQSPADPNLAERRRSFADECEHAFAEYSEAWLKRARTSDLPRIGAMFDRLAAEARSSG